MNTKRFEHHDCIKVRGKFWFELRYAAKLLHTSRAVVEALVVRKKLRSKVIEGVTYLPETQVTELRRDPAALKALKANAKLPKAPKLEPSMPVDTVYVGDARPDRLRVRPRIGHPLKDQA